MGQFLLLLVVALTAAAVVFGVSVLLTGSDPGMVPAEPDGRAVPLPSSRPLAEVDVSDVRFDTALRGYRMTQVDQAMRRAAYDIGYKDELIGVLEAEVEALREGRSADADALRQARVVALAPTGAVSTQDAPADVASAQDAPTDAGSTQDAPTDVVSAQDAPTDAGSTQDAPTDVVSARDAPQDAGSPQDARADSAGPAARSERG
jgi:DivIVA domain-containing protein